MKNLFFSFWSVLFLIPLLIVTVLQALSRTSLDVATNVEVFPYFALFFPLLGYYLGRCCEEFEMAIFSKFKVNLCNILCGLSFIIILSFCISAICAVKLVSVAAGGMLFFQITTRAFLFVFIYSLFLFSAGYLCGMIKNGIVSGILTAMVVIVFHPYVLLNWIIPVTYVNSDPLYYMADFCYLFNTKNAYNTYMTGGYDIRIVLKFLACLIPAVALLATAISLRSRKILPKLASIGGVIISVALIFPVFSQFAKYEVAKYSEDDFVHYQGQINYSADGRELTQYKFITSPQASSVSNIYMAECDIETDLSDVFGAGCRIVVKNDGAEMFSDVLCFRLDDKLAISKFTVNSAEADFIYMNGNYIKTEVLTLNPGETAEIYFEYSGILRYVSGILQPYASCMKDFCCLPSDFGWYPQLITDSEKECDFTLRLSTDNTVVTNLSYDSKDDIYYGKKESIFLYVGYLDKIDVDGRNVYFYPEFRSSVMSAYSTALERDCCLDVFPAMHFSVKGWGEQKELKDVLEEYDVTQIIFAPFKIKGGATGMCLDDNTVMIGEKVL